MSESRNLLDCRGRKAPREFLSSTKHKYYVNTRSTPRDVPRKFPWDTVVYHGIVRDPAVTPRNPRDARGEYLSPRDVVGCRGTPRGFPWGAPRPPMGANGIQWVLAGSRAHVLRGNPGTRQYRTSLQQQQQRDDTFSVSFVVSFFRKK